MNQNEQDLLKPIFSRLPDDMLPPAFGPEMMQRIRQEAIRIDRRNQRLRVLALMAVSIFTIGLAVATLIYLDIPRFIIQFPHVSIPPVYIYFGLLVLVLLFADYLLRHRYCKRHTG